MKNYLTVVVVEMVASILFVAAITVFSRSWVEHLLIRTRGLEFYASLVAFLAVTLLLFMQSLTVGSLVASWAVERKDVPEV